MGCHCLLPATCLVRDEWTPNQETCFNSFHPRTLLALPSPAPKMAARVGRAGPSGSRGRADADVASARLPTCPSPRSVRRPCPSEPDLKMAAPSGRRNGSGGANLWVSLLLAAVALRPVETVSEPTTVAFDVRPGGVVHSFSQNVGPGVRTSDTPGA